MTKKLYVIAACLIVNAGQWTASWKNEVYIFPEQSLDQMIHRTTTEQMIKYL